MNVESGFELWNWSAKWDNRRNEGINWGNEVEDDRLDGTTEKDQRAYGIDGGVVRGDRITEEESEGQIEGGRGCA